MKIKLISDLHVDSTKYHYTRGEEDLLIILGDIANGLRGIDWVKNNIPKDLRTLIVLGNHDFYGHEYEEVIQEWHAGFLGYNITVLHNEEVTIEGIRFIGGTMFSDFELSGISEAWFVKLRAKTAIADFELIKNWSPFRHCEEHEKFEKFLKYSYENTELPKKTIVLTHFCPSIHSIPDKFVTSYLNPFWASSMEHLFYGCDIWMHGHTHEKLDYEYAGTRVVCNPLGYWMENSKFEEDFIIVV